MSDLDFLGLSETDLNSKHYSYEFLEEPPIPRQENDATPKKSKSSSSKKRKQMDDSQSEPTGFEGFGQEQTGQKTTKNKKPKPFVQRTEERRQKHAQKPKNFKSQRNAKLPALCRKAVEYGELTESYVLIMTISKHGPDDTENVPMAYYTAPKILFVDAIQNQKKKIEIIDNGPHRFANGISESPPTESVPDPTTFEGKYVYDLTKLLKQL